MKFKVGDKVRIKPDFADHERTAREYGLTAGMFGILGGEYVVDGTDGDLVVVLDYHWHELSLDLVIEPADGEIWEFRGRGGVKTVRYVGPDGESSSYVYSSGTMLFEGIDTEPELEPIRCLGRWKD